MRSDGDVLFGVFFGAFLGLFIGGFVVASVLKEDIKSMRKQMLERGYAEFKSDKFGNPVFTWREPSAKQD